MTIDDPSIDLALFIKDQSFKVNLYVVGLVQILYSICNLHFNELRFEMQYERVLEFPTLYFISLELIQTKAILISLALITT